MADVSANTFAKAAEHTVRPFLLLGQSQLNAYGSQLRPLLDAWAQQWAVDSEFVSLQVSRAWEEASLSEENWQTLSATTGKRMLWHLPDSQLSQQILEVMFASERAVSVHGASLAAHAALLAYQDLTARLSQHLQQGAQTASLLKADAISTRLANCFAYASGALLLTLQIAGATLHILLEDGYTVLPALSATASKAKPPLASLSPATLGKLNVVLQVEAGQAEVALPNLLNLAPGDVIRLDRSIELPLTIRAPGGAAVFAGYLARADDEMVVEVVASS